MSDFRDDGAAALEWAASYLERVRDLPVLSQVEPGTIRAALPDRAPAEPEPFAAVLRDLDEVLMPGLTHWQSPRYFAYFATTATEPGILAELLAATLNQVGILWRTSPALQELEEVTLAWLADLLGLPAGLHGHLEDTASTGLVTALAAARAAAPGRRVVVCSGQTHSSTAKAARLLELELRTTPVDASFAFVTGCQTAHFTCLAAARQHVLAEAGWDVTEDGLAGSPPLTVLVGALRHSTIDRALRYLGIGRSQIRVADAHPDGSMDPAALRTALAEVDGPAIVCAQAGEVNSGVFDDLTAVADAVEGSSLSVLFLAWLVAVLVRVATGSATVATITAAGILAPVAENLSSPHVALMVLAIGAGSLFLSHVNDAGFWLVKEYFGMTVGQTIASWSVMETIVSVVGFLGVLLLHLVV